MVLVFTVLMPVFGDGISLPYDEHGKFGLRDESPAAKDVLSFTSEIPDCCTSHIVAERNTIPYLSVEKF